MRAEIIDALSRIERCLFACGASPKKNMIGARDPVGITGVSHWRFDGAYVLASNLRARPFIGATLRRKSPGEVVINHPKTGIGAISTLQKQSPRLAFSNIVYFARPTIDMRTERLREARKRIGEETGNGMPGRCDGHHFGSDSGNTGQPRLCARKPTCHLS